MLTHLKSLLREGSNPATDSRYARAVFVAVFLFLLLFRYQAITYPPYWDSILGIFHEAVWLAEHNFDYIKLAKEQPSYLEGGARVYFWTVFPGIQAILMKITPSPTAHFVVSHLLTYLLAAGLAMYFFKCCHRTLSVGQSALITIALVTCPLFLSQAYAINMEVMVIFFCMLGLWLFLQGRMLSAVCVLVLAFYTKSSSLVMSAALLGVYILFRFTLRPKKMLLAGLLMVPVFMTLIHGQIEKATFRASPSNLGFDLLVTKQLFTPWIVKEKVLRWFQTMPDVTIILFASLVLGGLMFGGLLILAVKEGWGKPGFIGRLRERFSEHELECICLLFGGLFVALAILMRVWIPRYMFTVLPMVFMLMGMVLFRFHHRLAIVVFTLVIMGNLLNAHGKLYIQPVRNQGYTLERSLEYEIDLELNQALADKLQADYADKTIVTYWPHVQMLSHPAFGYVEKPLHVVAGRRPVMAWHGVPFYQKLPKTERHGPNVVWVDPDNVFSTQPALDSDQGDKVIEEVTVGRRSIKIWQRTY